MVVCPARSFADAGLGRFMGTYHPDDNLLEGLRGLLTAAMIGDASTLNLKVTRRRGQTIAHGCV